MKTERQNIQVNWEELEVLSKVHEVYDRYPVDDYISTLRFLLSEAIAKGDCCEYPNHTARMVEQVTILTDMLYQVSDYESVLANAARKFEALTKGEPKQAA